MPERSIHLSSVLERSVEEFGERQHVLYDERWWTNVELLDRSQRLATSLVELGFAPGDRILTLLPNSPHVLVAYGALWRAGLTLVPLHTTTAPGEVAKFATAAGVSGMFVAEHLLGVVEPALAQLDTGVRVIACPSPPGAVAEASHVSVAARYSDLVSNERRMTAALHPPDDVAALLFTGGTTGRPKGVMLTHGNIWNGIHTIEPHAPGSTAVFVLPMNHIGGIAWGHMYARFAYRSIFATALTPAALLADMAKHRANIMHCIPTIYMSMLAYRDADQYDLSSMQHWCYSGAPWPDELIAAFEKRFPGRVEAIWGMTETAGCVTSTEPSPVRKPGCAGRPRPDAELAIMGADGQPVPRGEIGELWIKSPSVARGYLDMPEETERVFGGGWLRTGDLARIDEDGDLFLVGRAKDLIIRGGQNVYPEEVESVLARHPAVQFASVVGEPNEIFGEVVVGFVVLRPEAERATALRELDELCRQNLARYKCPRIEVIAEMPRTFTNKIDKKALRELTRQRAGDRDTALRRQLRDTSPRRRKELVQQRVRELVAQLLGAPASEVDVERPVMDLGMQSTQSVELASLLGDAIGLPIAATFAFSHPSVAAMADELVRQVSPEGARVEQRRATVKRADEPIAVVGHAFRFPGGLEDDDALWLAIQGGEIQTEDIPEGRWDLEGFHDPERRPGKSYVRRGGFVRDIDKFDAPFFNIGPAEATDMDPQHRLLLEVTWAALENAGIAPTSLVETKTGVYVAAGAPEYMFEYLGTEAYGGATGGLNSVAAGRISFVLGLRGPAFTVDTACSSSLVAIHNAIRALRNGECDLAIVGGVNTILSRIPFVTLCNLGALAPDGRCKAFDASGDGFGRAEGCGVIVLERQADAVARRHPIRALVRGSALNHDGFSTALTAPNGAAQEELLRLALDDAGLDATQVGLVECHGTGTPLGDPIEVAAISRVVGAGSGRRRPVYLSSLKANFGHLEWAAGVGGVIRSILSLEHREIAPVAGVQQLNPHLRLEQSSAVVPTERVPWTAERRVVGVSSFGFSGTNAHVILEEAPELERPARTEERPLHVLPLSARSRAGVRELAKRYARKLVEKPSLRIEDVCATAGAGRGHFDQRAAIVARDRAELRAILKLAAADGDHPKLVRGQRPLGDRRKVAMLFTGQGSQYVGMGRELYATQPLFKRVLDQCDQIMRGRLGRSLLDVIFPSDSASGDRSIHDTEHTQPALFAIEYALAELWRSWGVEPDAVLGHSIGEYVAACRANVFDLETGLLLVAARGRLMQALPAGGSMAAVRAPVDVVEAAVARHAERGAAIAMAGYNAPTSQVISGARETVDAIAAELEAQGADVTRLKTSHAFHSPLMEPMLADFHDVAASMTFYPPTTLLVSNVTGELHPEGVAPGADYWTQHVRAAVKFQQGMATLAATGHRAFVEAGPQPVLIDLGKQSVPGEHVWVPSLRRGLGDWERLTTSVAEYYASGGELDWEAFTAGSGARRVALPTYPFEKKRYWHPIQEGRAAAGEQLEHPLVVARSKSPAGVVLTARLGGERSAYLREHRVYGGAVFPGTGFIELAAAAARIVFALSADASVVLEDFSFQRALALPDDGEVVASILLHPVHDGACELEISTESAGEHGSIPEAVVHARGRIVLDAKTAATAAVSIASLEQRMAAVTEADALYALLRDRGLEYGPAFRGATQLRAPSDRAVNEAFGRVELPAAQRGDAGRHAVHPALLDAALHVMSVVPAVRESLDRSSSARLPIGVRRIEIERSGAERAWVHVALTSVGDDGLVADLRMLADDGTPIVTLTGFEARRVDQAALRRALGMDVRDWFYRPTWEPRTEAATAAPPATWLVVRGEADAALASAFASETRAAIVDRPLSAAALTTTIARARAELGTLDGVLFLAGAVDVSEPAREARVATTALLHVAQALAAEDAPPRLVIATRAANLVGEGERVQPAATALWGLGRVVALEHPELRCLRIDLGDDDETAVLDLARDLRTAARLDEREPELAIRDSVRHVARLQRWQPPGGRLQRPGGASFELFTKSPGVLDGIGLRTVDRRAPGPGELEVEVRVGGLNFRDVMNAMGAYPGGPEPFGGECAGTVVAVGPGVSSVAVGDEVVVGLVRGAFRQHVVAQERFTIKKPAWLGFAPAVTMPVTYLTAMYGLDRLAHLARGERVLIHAGAGGVGIAAIQLALHRGAIVFTTAGSPRKRSFLRRLGAHHVYDSRSLAFADEIRRDTNGEGVDVVLNSLTGAFVPASLGLLRANGRFIEIGKLDLLRPEQVPAGLHYHHFDTGEVCLATDGLFQELWNELLGLVQAGAVAPLPHRTYAVEDAIAAFRHMAQGKHVGKLVITFGDRPEAAPRADGSYLVTGGTGALGVLVARSLLSRGAGHVILASRSGVTPAELASDPRVATVAADVARLADVERLVAAAETRAPLRGVIHAAGVLDDRMLAAQTADGIAKTFAPKVDGAWNLHVATQRCSLDSFVMFGSVAARFGNAGQANYAAANAFLDGLADARRAAGLPGLCIDWGPWGQVGMAATEELEATRRQLGVQGIGSDDGIRAFELLLDEGAEQALVIGIEWSRFLASPMGQSPLFGKFVAAEKPSEGARKNRALEEAMALTGPARREKIAAFLADEVRAVLGLEAGTPIDGGVALPSLGLDSLMAVELRNRIGTATGKPLPPRTISEHGTIDALSAFIDDKLLGVTTAPAPAAAAPAPVSAPTIVDLSVRTAPLFCFPPSGGDATTFGPFAELLGPWPIAVIDTPAGNSIVPMAQAAAKVLQAAQPTGPVRLFGHSFGATLAHRVAWELEQAGREVAFVWMLEGVVSWPSAPTPLESLAIAFDDRVYRSMRALESRDRAAIDAADQRCLAAGGAAGDAMALQWAREHDVLTPKLTDAVGLPRIDAARRTLQLLVAYEPPPIRSEVVLGWSSIGPRLGAWNWRDFVRGACDEVTIAGDHFSCMLGVGVDMVADLVHARLARALARKVA